MRLLNRRFIQCTQTNLARASLFCENHGHDSHLLLHAVEYNQVAVEHEERIFALIVALNLVIGFALPFQPRLKPVCSSITKVSDCAACQRAQLAEACQFVLLKMPSEVVRYAFGMRFDYTLFLNRRLISSAAYNHVRIRAEKGILGYYLATLDGFQKKSVTGWTSDIHKRIKRVDRIGCDGPGHGDNVRAGGFLRKLSEVCRMKLRGRRVHLSHYTTECELPA